MTEREAEKLTRGSHAALVKNSYEKELLLKKEKLISELCGIYKSGNLLLPNMSGKLGEIVCVNDILQSLNRAISDAQKLEEKMTHE